MSNNNNSLVAEIAMLKEINKLMQENKALAEIPDGVGEGEEVEVATPPPPSCKVNLTKFNTCKKGGVVISPVAEMATLCKAYKRTLPLSGQTVEIGGETFIAVRKGGGMIPLVFECTKLGTKALNEVLGTTKKMITVQDKARRAKREEARRQWHLENAMVDALKSTM